MADRALGKMGRMIAAQTARHGIFVTLYDSDPRSPRSGSRRWTTGSPGVAERALPEVDAAATRAN